MLNRCRWYISFFRVAKNDSAAVVAASGRTKRRNRMLPARVTAYFSIGMCTPRLL